MAQLQRPPFVYMNGKLTGWDDATVHIASEALIRGISVFEGIKGYWSHDEQTLSLLALRAHYERLVNSARLMHLPFALPYEEFEHACALLVRKLCVPEKDLWIRPTVYAREGHWGEGTVSDLAITCYHQEKRLPGRIKIGVSTWQRPLDTGLPARIKSAANYQIGRLARIEGRAQGFDDMVLLNPWGRIAEGTGSAVLIVRDGCVISPPSYEGCLESITVCIIGRLCETLEIPFERRPVDRTELQVADEIALAGTLMELGIVSQVEQREMPARAPIFERIRDEYWACVRREREHASIVLTAV